MSILIKGLSIPKNCFTDDCPCLNGESGYCQADKEHRYVYGDRPYWCPLVPVPPHGDLIDRAELWVEINKTCDRRDAGIITDLTCLQQILSALRHAPTIIPAEGASDGL